LIILRSTLIEGGESMNLLKLTDKAYEQYQLSVKGNIGISKDQAARKLTRNVLLAKELPPKTKLDRLLGNKTYAYGNLHIDIRRGKVVKVSNHYGRDCHNGWEFNKKKYIELTKQLGIEDNKFNRRK
jgi:hypothetical protein